jgi:hypothetical protein
MPTQLEKREAIDFEIVDKPATRPHWQLQIYLLFGRSRQELWFAKQSWWV